MSDLTLEPLRQVAHPAGEGAPIPRPARARRPDHRRAARRRVRRGLRRRRQPAVPRDRHDEEHGLRDGAAGSDRSRRDVRAGAGRSFHRQAGVSRVRISVVEQPLGPAVRRPASRIRTRSCRPGAEHWTAVVTRDAQGSEIVVRAGEPRGAQDDRLGVFRIPARRVHDAARDRGSHHGDVDDRRVDLRPGASRFRRARRSPRRAASRRSRLIAAGRCSTRCTPWARRRWRRAPTITAITLTLPNRHHLLVDLQPFGLDNPNEIFVATDQPFGLIEATIRRQA